MITAEDKACSSEVVEALTGAFITGSFLTNPKTAGDIDVVVGSSAFALHKAIHPKDPALCGNQVMISDMVFTIQDGDEIQEYGDPAGEDGYEIVCHLRCGGINILVVRDIFIAAYRAASYRLVCDPKRYAYREDRVEMHQEMKDIIRNMLSDAANSCEAVPF